MIRRLTACVLLGAATLAPPATADEAPFAFGSPAAVQKAGELKGRLVETRDGEELGRVHDFALDLASGRIAYVVVSVGSFLIEDSLIAVAPDALRESADADGRLVLETDAASLRGAARFSAGDWPIRADVLASAPRSSGDADTPDHDGTAAPARRGTATISSDRKTATLSAGEKSIRVEARPPSEPAPAVSPIPPLRERRAPDSPFGRLDRDGDGLLNRAEIAHELDRDDNYSDIDLDASGTIDPAEFDALMESRQQSGEAAPSS